MSILIKEISLETLDKINKINDSFIVDSTLILSLEDNEIRYTVKDIPSYEKSYLNEEDDTNYKEYTNNPNKVIYLAFLDNRVIGQIILKRNWNEFAYIEDIKIDKDYRRQGVGLKLIEYAKSWAKENNMPGLMLETQNNNVKACEFYEKCGFKIGGFDFNLYRGVNRNSNEFAIYWYFIFGRERT